MTIWRFCASLFGFVCVYVCVQSQPSMCCLPALSLSGTGNNNNEQSQTVNIYVSVYAVKQYMNCVRMTCLFKLINNELVSIATSGSSKARWSPVNIN